MTIRIDRGEALVQKRIYLSGVYSVINPKPTQDKMAIVQLHTLTLQSCLSTKRSARKMSVNAGKRIDGTLREHHWDRKSS